MPASTMCTGGTDDASRPLPSLVHIMTVPDSAISALAPVMPTSAVEEDAAGFGRGSCAPAPGCPRWRPDVQNGY